MTLFVVHEADRSPAGIELLHYCCFYPVARVEYIYARVGTY
jgi:hypothetical protein